MLAMADSHFTMVRPGISTYGYWPSRDMAEIKILEGLKPILRLDSRIALVKELPAGHSCGYGRTFQAQRPTRIGIVPLGYADGYRRSFSNKAVMLIDHCPVPVIGRVSMDQTIVDLTDQPQVNTGHVVTVISEKRDDPNSVEALAELANTIPHEITCLLGRRIARQAVARF
jgi:alanine racemase